MTYAQAISTVTELNRQALDGFNDWKLPHLKDLAFIAEQHCRNPRVRLEYASLMTLIHMFSPWILAFLVFR